MTVATATESASAPTGHRAAPGLTAAIAAEWTKARTARAPRRNLILGVVLAIASSVLLSVLVGTTFDDWSASEQAEFDPILYPLSGSLLMAIFFVAASVGVVVSEYSSGMIRLSLTVVPNRARFLAAKAIVVAVAIGIASTIAVGGMLFGAQMVYAANGLPTAGLGDGDFLRTLILLVVTGPALPVISVVAAFVFRSAAAAVTSTLAIILLPSMFGTLLPSWWQRNVLSLMPGNAADSLAMGHLTDSEMYPSALPAALVVVAWIVVPLLVAHRLLVTRDAA